MISDQCEPASFVNTTNSTWQLRPLGSEWDSQWDLLVSRSPESGFMQSSGWAAFKRLERYDTVRYGLFDEDALRGGATLFTYPAGQHGGLILCPEGPVLPWDDTSRARSGLRLILEAARDLAVKNGDLGLRIEPHLAPPAPPLLRNWSRAPIDLMPIHTLLLDINQTNEQLRAQMQPKGRYNSKLAARHGVSVRPSCDMQDIQPFHALFMETAQRGNFFAEPYGFFLNLGMTLFPRKQAMLFFAEWRGEILGSILVIFSGRRATYLYGGSTTRHRQVMPNYALHWAAIEEARARGCVEYDLFGYDPFGQLDHLYAGFSRFKRQWGGRRFDSMGAYDCIFYDQLADRMVNHLKADAAEF